MANFDKKYSLINKQRPITDVLSVLKLIQNKLNKLNSEIILKNKLNNFEQIILDNYFILDSKIKLLLKINKKIKINLIDNSPALGKIILDLCSGNSLPLINEISREIGVFQGQYYVTDAEFNEIKWEFNCAIIFKINELINENNSDNLINLFNLISKSDEINCKEIIKNNNLIDLIFKNDPEGVYENCDEITQKIYREKTAKIAKKSNTNEVEIAKKMLEKAQSASSKCLSHADCHVGNYIFKEYNKLFKRISSQTYISILISFSIIFTIGISAFFKNPWLILLLFFPIWEIIRAILDFFCSTFCRTSYLPRLNFKGKIPETAKTLAVVSTILTSLDEIDELKLKLKKIFFSNISDNFYLCLLCDFLGSDYPEMPQDSVFLKLLDKLTAELNQENGSHFITIVRRRTYSPSEEKYIGYERKRGAIEQLVKFANGEKLDFAGIFGNKEIPSICKYIVTLDYDTRPLLDSISELVSVAEHPLNTARISGNMVISGYGVVVPRITTTLSSSLQTPFTRYFGGIGSSNAYDNFSSNLYQDCFDEGIFSGKGLINIEAFYKTCCEKFPENSVLSHDILEGNRLRTGFAGNIEFRDEFPQTSEKYFKRHHRWVRGDIQNIIFLGSKIDTPSGKIKNNFSKINKFKIFDNIRRSFLQILIYLSVFIFGFFIKNNNIFPIILVVLSALIPFIFGILNSIKSNLLFIFKRKKYLITFSEAKTLAIQMLYNFILLPQNAVISADAIAKSVWRRFFSHKKTLEWTTSSQQNKNNFAKFDLINSCLIAEIFNFILIFSENILIKILAIIWLTLPILIHFGNIKYNKIKNNIPNKYIQMLSENIASMWRFYEDFAQKTDNYLPPDNVQFSPVKRICHRTSPTNIGMMLLSELSAFDFNLINSDELFLRIDRVISSVEKMEKYCGNLYNWYNTKTLKLSPNPFVSAVDSGNFICCLVALKEGIIEIRANFNDKFDLVNRINLLINSTDLSIFYDENRNLFSIGIDISTGKKCENHYDMLMSEARMLSYFAISRHLVPKKHWSCLARTMKSSGNLSGCVSYSGTMFEYFMPELLLKSEQNSLTYESIKYAYHCQKARGNKLNLPFGISESAYNSFDNDLNYQYKANGVQSCVIRLGLNNNMVISPYSTFLCLEMGISATCKNLLLLKKYGMNGNYGFYEAIDFTNNTNGTIIKSYMAHHIGMSIVSISNALHCEIMRKRFTNDPYSSSASELLEEKVISGEVLYDEIAQNQTIISKKEHEINEYFEKFYVTNLNAKMFSNGEMTIILTDIGAEICLYNGIDVFRRTSDLLRRPQGCFFAFACEKIKQNLTYSPTYTSTKEMNAEFSDNSVIFKSSYGKTNISMEITLDKNLPCVYHNFTVKNMNSCIENINVLCYLEPTLLNFSDYESHPAFMDMFLELEFAEEDNIIYIKRIDRGSGAEIFCAIGFVNNEIFSYNFSREEVLTAPFGTSSAFDNFHKLDDNSNYLPSPCIYIDAEIAVNPYSEQLITLFCCVSHSKETLLRDISIIRNSQENRPCSNFTFPLNSLENRVLSDFLPQIFFKQADGNENYFAIKKNTLSLNELWKFGISGNLPIIVIPIANSNEVERITTYLNCHNVLKVSGILTDIVFLFKKSSQEFDEFNTNIKKIIADLCYNYSLEKNGGIFILNTEKICKKIINLILASASHVAPKSLVRIGKHVAEFAPIPILGVNSDKNGWEFSEKSVKISNKTDQPWCQVLSNPVFGTLCSNSALGYTYAINSRENKLTPWFNDTKTDNRGEMILLKCDDIYYDLVLGASAEFSAYSVEYCGETSLFSSKVSVKISEKGCCKSISVRIIWKSSRKLCKLLYYTEPVLSSSRETSRLIKAEIFEDALVLNNPANVDISGFMAISSPEKFSATTDRTAVLSGKLTELTLSSHNNLCACAIMEKNFSNDEAANFNFFLSFGKTKKSAVLMPKFFKNQDDNSQNQIKINTSDKNLNSIFNVWLYNQTLKARIFGKTGFYQNSGAFGFRDQLQDACAVLLKNPIYAKQQVYKACAAQFVEGDVLHWWHKLPNAVMRGVRTKYSDDLLWLPYTVSEFIEKTSDKSILTAKISYSLAPILSKEQHEIYFTVTKSPLAESVYNHCKRAIERAFQVGEHGILLIGGGDWNDGFNKIGADGTGESVWLTEFYILVLKKFIAVANLVGDAEILSVYAERIDLLSKKIDENCWDGDWYVRAFLDDGSPLGSKNCSKCKIDSLAQSFATLSGLPNSARKYSALESAYDNLVDEKAGIIKLFSPSFDKLRKDIGYVSAYPSGIRENGGQYTHAAIWLCIALLENNNIEQGFKLIQMLNPANKYQGNSTKSAYKNEPYYLSADIYTNPQCFGRGGWSIYTGAAGWYYRAIFEWLLGVKIDKTITFRPKIPAEWNGFDMEMVYNYTKFKITVKRGSRFEIIDNGLCCKEIEFDKKSHEVIVIITKNQ
ncbi:MAG: glucoamylase family protein [Oscillospiraceae bacterium]